MRVDFAAGHLNFPSRPRARAQPKRNASTLNLTSPAYPSPSPSPSPNVALSWMRSARPARFFCNTRTYFSGGRPSPPHRPFLTFFSKTSVRPTSVRALVCSVVVRFFLLLGGLRPRELRDFGFPLFIYSPPYSTPPPPPPPHSPPPFLSFLAVPARPIPGPGLGPPMARPDGGEMRGSAAPPTPPPGSAPELPVAPACPRPA